MTEMNMEINYPKKDFKIKATDGVQYIWDAVRRKWVRLTPEEWVRQNFVQYLLLEKKYPASLLAIEKGIELNGLKKRCDIVVFLDGRPWMIVECKEPDVALSENVFMQIVRYNMVLKVPYLVITNGPHTLAWNIEEEKIEALAAMPVWVN
ncbi:MULTISPECIES: type I restriction enzyme HsdR N-terminal domain-containing protein [Chitinophagaceae]